MTSMNNVRKSKVNFSFIVEYGVTHIYQQRHQCRPSANPRAESKACWGMKKKLVQILDLDTPARGGVSCKDTRCRNRITEAAAISIVIDTSLTSH